MQNDTNEDRNLLMEESEFTNLDWTTDDERMDMATENLFQSLTFKTPKNRKDAIANLKRHLRAVLIVFSRLAQFNPSESLAYPRNNNIGTASYKGSYQPFNPFNYNFKKIREVLDALEDYGFVGCELGRQDYFEGNYQGRVSRYILCEGFVRFVERYELTEIEYTKELLNNGIVVKKSVPGRENKILVTDYTSIIEPEDVAQSKRFLKLYNDLISKADIAITHQESQKQINLQNCYTYRVFQDEEFTLDGRFYGGWWTNCKKEDRWFIAINDEQTVECDYRSNHLYLFYGLNGQEISENLRSDPYAISEVYPRSLIKLLITRYFNCGGEYGIIKHIRSVRDGYRDDKKKNRQLIKEYLPSDKVCREVMDIIFFSHPVLRLATNSDWGLRLMNWDSKVALYVLRTMTDEGIPVLCIH
ncbi:MAG: hypothetical protein CMH28_07780, partial [Micavibrio sp.]|nr:hypothetical protein [Micavibrio sp.]